MDLLESLKRDLLRALEVLGFLRQTTPLLPVTLPTVVPSTPMLPPKYLWDTRQNVRHSIRVICDELGFTFEQKNTMCATIGAESIGYNTRAVNKNYVLKPDGTRVLASTDWGLCQWNDYYHGKEISCGYSGDAMNDPEKAVRLMASYWKRGESGRILWIAYKNGSYKAYL